jgi:hypothetical protein
MTENREPILRFRIEEAGPFLEDQAEAGRVNRIAALNSALREHQRTPRIAGYPPKIFISYRWENEWIKSWARRLAAQLRALNYGVFLDLEKLVQVRSKQRPGVSAKEDRARLGKDIALHVNRVVDAQWFIRVVTRRYVDDLFRDWIYEEDKLAKLSENTGLRIAHIILRDGEEPPDWSRHTVVDLRSNPDDFSQIEKLVGVYKGVVLNESEEQEFISLLETCGQLLRTGRPDRVGSLLANAKKYENTFEYRVILAHTHLAMGHRAAAAHAAVSIDSLPGRPTVETVTDVALLLEEMGFPRPALHYVVRLLPLPGALRVQNLRLAGSLLDDAQNYFAARNMLRYALQLASSGSETPWAEPGRASDHTLRMAVANTLGYVTLFGLRDPEGAIGYFEQAEPFSQPTVLTNYIVCLASLQRWSRLRDAVRHARRLAASHPQLRELVEALDRGVDVGVKGPPMKERVTHRCNHCRATIEFTDESTLCAACGSVNKKPFSGNWSCGYCGETRVSPLGWLAGAVGCPVCRTGVLVPS